MHIAYIRYAAPMDNPPVYYGYCPGPAAKCIDPAAWSLVTFAGQAGRVELALTSTGKPRLLYQTDYYVNGASSAYTYAECNGICADPAAWTVGRVTEHADSDVYESDVAHHEFALDPQDRPRFIFATDYYNSAPRVPRTLYYMACDASCADPASWTKTDLNPSNNNDIFERPVLAFTPQGQPRVLTERVVGGGTPTSIYYMTCDVDCTSVSNWWQMPLLTRGYGTNPSWDLEINAQGGLRAAVYQGVPDGGGNAQLYYIGCDADCLNLNAWFGQPLLSNGAGENPDLELDTQGRPRIAYNTAAGKGLSYLWCNTACDSGSGTWLNTLAESSSLLDATFPVAVPFACPTASWAGALKPSLALDAAGNAYVGYVAQHLMRCNYSDPQNPAAPPTTRIEKYLFTRFSFFPQP
jgi:hypothetical protein